MYRLTLLLLPIFFACQDQSQNPEMWTVQEVHQDVGLVGGHQLACGECHQEIGFKGVTPDCESCHLALYDETTNPNHRTAGYPVICKGCHESDAWQPAFIDHDAFGFPLEGTHAQILCADCHVGGPFAALPADCWSCHDVDEPVDHFGPECAECHTTAAWEPSTFDHEPLFPLIRGKHSRYRDRCGSCHLDPTDYALFTCTDCHDDEHSRSRTDRKHDDVRDYIYETMACFKCHPRGSEDDAEKDDG